MVTGDSSIRGHHVSFLCSMLWLDAKIILA
jgi:hypothetical protein